MSKFYFFNSQEIEGLSLQYSNASVKTIFSTDMRTCLATQPQLLQETLVHTFVNPFIKLLMSLSQLFLHQSTLINFKLSRWTGNDSYFDLLQMCTDFVQDGMCQKISAFVVPMDFTGSISNGRTHGRVQSVEAKVS